MLVVNQGLVLMLRDAPVARLYSVPIQTKYLVSLLLLGLHALARRAALRGPFQIQGQPPLQDLLIAQGVGQLLTLTFCF